MSTNRIVGISAMTLAALLAACPLVAMSAPATQPAPVAAGGTSGGAPGASTQPAINWPDLLGRLGNADYTVRQQAQQDLAKVDYRQRDTMKHLADAADDAEVRSALVKRLEDIAEQLVIDPPPISLDIKNATLADTAAALSKALNTPLGAWPPNQGFGNGVRFTLHGTDMPFWEVFAALSRQHGLQFQSFGNEGLRLVQSDPPMQNMIRAGGFAVFPTDLTRTAVVNLRNPPGQQVQPEQMALNCTIMADPRIKIIRYTQAQFTEVVDDAGNVLLKGAENGPSHYWESNQPNWSASASLSIPRALGKKIASAKGLGFFEVQLAQETVEVADFETKFQTPIVVGGRTLTFSQFELKQGTIRFQCAVPDARGGMRFFPGQDNPEPLPMEVRFIDASGSIARHTVSGGLGGSTGGGFTGPIKIQVSLPTKTKRITVPFELKDLPLPQFGQP